MANRIEEFHICYDLDGGTKDGYIGDNETPNGEFCIELLSIAFMDRESGNEYYIEKNVIDRFNQGKYKL